MFQLDHTDETADPKDKKVRKRYWKHRPNAALIDLKDSGHPWMIDRHLDGFDDEDTTPVRPNVCPYCGSRLYPEDARYVCEFVDRAAWFDTAGRPGARVAKGTAVPVLRVLEEAPPFRDFWKVSAPWCNPKTDTPPYWTPDPAPKTEPVGRMVHDIVPVLAVPGQFDEPIRRCPVVALIRPLFHERDDCQCSPCTLRRNPPQPVVQPRAHCGKPVCDTTHDTATTAKRRAKRRANDRLRARAEAELERFPGLTDREIAGRIGIHWKRVAEARSGAEPASHGGMKWWTHRENPDRPPRNPAKPSKNRESSWFGPIVTRQGPIPDGRACPAVPHKGRCPRGVALLSSDVPFL